MKEEDDALQEFKHFLKIHLEPEIFEKLKQREISLNRSDFLDILKISAKFAVHQRFDAVGDLAKSLMREKIREGSKPISELDAEPGFEDLLKNI